MYSYYITENVLYMTCIFYHQLNGTNQGKKSIHTNLPSF